jgi:hypothetical protein
VRTSISGVAGSGMIPKARPMSTNRRNCLILLERETGFEPATNGLEVRAGGIFGNPPASSGTLP